MTMFGAKTAVSEVASAFSDRIKGKNILITGCSPGGLGAEFAQAIAPHEPGILILAGRNLSLMQEEENILKAAVPILNTRTLELDLFSQKQVRKAAAEVNSYDEPIHILVNNAGISWGGYKLSEEGIERAFAINHIGHFLFTNLIMPKIYAGGPGARIVNLSSGGHRYGPVRFDDINFQDGAKYVPMEAYAQSKTANILFSVQLAKILKGRGILSFSVHPGSIASTSFMRDIPLADRIAMGFTDENNVPIEKVTTWKTLPEGASTTAVAAFDPSIEGLSGSYLRDCHIERGDEVAPYAFDEGNAVRLWKLSERLIGQKFAFE